MISNPPKYKTKDIQNRKSQIIYIHNFSIYKTLYSMMTHVIDPY